MAKQVPTTQTPTPQGGSTPALAVPELAGAPTLAASTLTLRGARPPWTYCVSAAALQCVGGEIVPILAKAPHEPGALGNAPGPNRGEGAVAYMKSRGYRRVPHDLAGLVAFGELCVGGVSTYLARWTGVTTEGRPVAYHTDRWTRPISLGHLTEWERDTEGWLAFLMACRRLVLPDDKLSDLHIRIATRAVVSEVERLLDRPTDHPRTQRLLRQYAANLPRKYAPEALHPFYPTSAEAPTE